MRRQRFRFSLRNAEPRAICDRCGFEVFHRDLRMQDEYRGGDAPVPIGILVCGSCYDKPNPQLGRPVIKQDPTPVRNPRPPHPNWILDVGIWSDVGVWDDQSVWKDE